MTLTKLKYNTSIFADGLPITLKFAAAVGEIVTAARMATEVRMRQSATERRVRQS